MYRLIAEPRLQKDKTRRGEKVDRTFFTKQEALDYGKSEESLKGFTQVDDTHFFTDDHRGRIYRVKNK